MYNCTQSDRTQADFLMKKYRIQLLQNVQNKNVLGDFFSFKLVLEIARLYKRPSTVLYLYSQ